MLKKDVRSMDREIKKIKDMVPNSKSSKHHRGINVKFLSKGQNRDLETEHKESVSLTDKIKRLVLREQES